MITLPPGHTWVSYLDHLNNTYPARAARGVQGPIPADLTHFFILEFSGVADEQTNDLVFEELKSSSTTLHVDREPIYYIQATPNDPLLSAQWHLGKVNAFEAWDSGYGSPDITIAVIDTGLDELHPDFDSSNLKVNSAEIPGNGVDDDGNSLIDDVYGWDFINNDNDPNDDHGHGTHVTGIYGAKTNNSIGIAGISPNVKTLPIKGCNVHGRCNSMVPLWYAFAQGADIANLSLGGTSYSKALETVVEASHRGGMVVIASGGNSNQEGIYFFPASYNGAIAVGSTTSLDQRSGFSNFGYHYDVMAPGSSILSLRSGEISPDPNHDDTFRDFSIISGNYIYASGTSMATPLVSGAVALKLSADPTFKVEEIREYLGQTADDVGETGFDFYMNHGRLNADTLLNSSIARCSAKITSPWTHERVEGETALGKLKIKGTVDANPPYLHSGYFHYSLSVYKLVSGAWARMHHLPSRPANTQKTKFDIDEIGTNMPRSIGTTELLKHGTYKVKLTVRNGVDCASDEVYFVYDDHAPKFMIEKDSTVSTDQVLGGTLAWGNLKGRTTGSGNPINSTIALSSNWLKDPSSYSGRLYVHDFSFNTSSPIPTGVVNASTLDYAFVGDSTYEHVGESALFADIDGDGKEDVFIGIPYANDGASKAGAVAIFLSSNSSSWSNSTPIDSADYILKGEFAYNYLGMKMEKGDFDNDGKVDIVVMAPNFTVGSDDWYQKYYIIYGKDYSTSWPSSQSISSVSSTQLTAAKRNSQISLYVEDGNKFTRSRLKLNIVDYNKDGISDLFLNMSKEIYLGQSGSYLPTETIGVSSISVDSSLVSGNFFDDEFTLIRYENGVGGYVLENKLGSSRTAALGVYKKSYKFDELDSFNTKFDINKDGREDFMASPSSATINPHIPSSTKYNVYYLIHGDETISDNSEDFVIANYVWDYTNYTGFTLEMPGELLWEDFIAGFTTGKTFLAIAFYNDYTSDPQMVLFYDYQDQMNKNY